MHPSPTHCPVPPYLPFTHAACSPKLFKNKTNEQLTSLCVCATTLHSSGAMLCHKAYPFVQSAPPQNIHCSEPLVWLKPSSRDPPETPLGHPAAASNQRDPVAS